LHITTCIVLSTYTLCTLHMTYDESNGEENDNERVGSDNNENNNSSPFLSLGYHFQYRKRETAL
jgi:hypothetical protein